MSELLGSSQAVNQGAQAAQTASTATEAAGQIASNPALVQPPVGAPVAEADPMALTQAAAAGAASSPTQTAQPGSSFGKQVGQIGRTGGEAIKMLQQLAQMGQQRQMAIPAPAAAIQLQRGMPMSLMQPTSTSPVARGGLGGGGGMNLLQLLALLGSGRR